MQAVIMAGGKGTRLAELTRDEIPKPMVELAGKPLLLWQIERLKENGIQDILLVIGHLGSVIRDYFGDGSRFGVKIRYFEEKEPLGTAGSFYYLKDLIRDEEFLMMSGDLMFDVDFDRMVQFHREKKAAATLFVHPNGHPYDSDLLALDEEDRVIRFDSKHNTRDYWYENCVNAGIFVFGRRIFDYVPEPVKRNLENDVIQAMVRSGEAVYGYRSPEYVKDVGTMERIHQTQQDLERGGGAGAGAVCGPGDPEDQRIGLSGGGYYKSAGGGAGNVRDGGRPPDPQKAGDAFGPGGRVPGWNLFLSASPGQRLPRGESGI